MSDTAIKAMAKIMRRLNHAANENDKDKLRKIIAGDMTSENEKILARSLLNYQDSVAEIDKQHLSAILEDKLATDNERNLAEIILHFDQKTKTRAQYKLHLILK